MAEENEVKINVEEIMTEIRRDVQIKEDLENLPAFEDIPIRDENYSASGPDINWAKIEEDLNFVIANHEISYYEELNGNPLVVFVKRVIRKMAVFLITPILWHQNDLNSRYAYLIHNLYTSNQQLREILDDQQHTINELKRTIKIREYDNSQTTQNNGGLMNKNRINNNSGKNKIKQA